MPAKTKSDPPVKFGISGNDPYQPGKTAAFQIEIHPPEVYYSFKAAIDKAIAICPDNPPSPVELLAGPFDLKQNSDLDFLIGTLSDLHRAGTQPNHGYILTADPRPTSKKNYQLPILIFQKTALLK